MGDTGLKIRVAIIIPRIANLGPMIVIQNLVNSLSYYKNISIRLFYLDSRVDSNIQISVPVERLNAKKFSFTDYDIIHTNGIRPDLFGYLNRKKIKYHISTIHNFVFEDLTFSYNRIISWFFGNIWLLLWKRADKLICVSKAMKNYYTRWLPSEKLDILYNGIAETVVKNRPDDDIVAAIDNFHVKGLKVLGTVGILTKRKGIDQLLNFLADEKGFAIVIMGDGKELRNLLHLSRKLRIVDRCLFCGFRDNVVCYLSKFDTFVMPSRSEGFCLALIEAVQQMLPVVCSDIAVFKELFTEDEVMFFKLEDKSSLSEALKSTVENGKMKVEKAFSKYLNYYTTSIMANHYFELYKSA